MSLIYLSDVLKRAGLDITKVKLIRHALSDNQFRTCYEAGCLKEYTQTQKKNFSKGYDHWVIFVSDKGTSAKLECCYKVHEWVDNTPDLAPEHFPFQDWFDGKGAYFNLEKTDLLSELEGRLIIDWGGATRA